MYTTFCLTDERDRLGDRSINKNDIYDIAAFSIAIPYCDIVIGEKMFISIAKDRKLDALYDTKLGSSLEDLYEFLK